MAEVLIRRTGELSWRSPLVGAVTNEDQPQELLATSPELIPGLSPDCVTVREFPIPGSGQLDILAVDSEGSMTLVECKLRANPEIRRLVMGQALAYAAGLWRTTYEELDAAVERHNGEHLFRQIEATAPDDWDPDGSRSVVAANLAAGRFRLVIAVNEITDELKRSVVYLNQHSAAELGVVALELGMVADEGIEILIPSAYGEETASTKHTTSRHAWDEASFFEKADELSSPEVRAVIDILHQWAVDHQAEFNWGDGRFPSMSAWIRLQTQRRNLWSCYLRPDELTNLAFNFEWIARDANPDELIQLADSLSKLPEAKAVLTGIQSHGFKRRPSVPLAGVLTRKNTLETVLEAFDELIRSAQLSDNQQGSPS